MKSLLVVSLLFLFSSSFSQKAIPELWGQRIHDEAKILRQSTIDGLEKSLKIFEDSTSNQIAILIIPSLDSDGLEEYGLRVAEAWKLGTKLKDNGVLFLIAVDDHKMRIEVGQGLQGILTDAHCNQIIRNEVAPAFRRSRYDEGVMAGVNAIIKSISGEYHSDEKEADENAGWIIFGVIFGLFCIGALIYSFIKEMTSSNTNSSTREATTNHSSNYASVSSSGSSNSVSSFSGRGGSFDGGGSSGGW